MPTWITSRLVELGVVAALLVGCWLGLLWYGHKKYLAGQQDTIAAINKQTQRVKENSNKITVGVVTKYIEHTEVIHKQGATIIKKVPVYVTRKDNSRCTINTGFVSLWNGSNKGILPPATATVNATPSPVVISDVASQHSRESLICRGTEQRLSSLQEWVQQQYQTVNGKPLLYH